MMSLKFKIKIKGSFIHTPSLRRSSRLVEKREKEKCLSCAPAPVILTRTSSASSNGCSGCTDKTPRRQRTPSTSRKVDSRSSIFNGLHLPLGQQPSSFARCSSSPCYSAAGSVPATSARAGPVMASSSTSSGPPPAAPPSPCRNRELFLAELAPVSLVRQSLPQLPTQIQPGGCGPPPVGPPFPRPMLPMTGISQGCLTRSFHPSSTMGATSTTRSASVAYLDAAGTPSSTALGLTLTTIGERTPAVSLSWTPPLGHVEPLLPAVPSGSPSPLSQLSATGFQRAQSCQTSRPPSPRSRRNSMSAVAVDTGVDASHEFLVDVETPRTGVYTHSSL